VLKIKNLTPSKFADEIGIQRSSMSHIMSGRNLPSLDLITKILNKYPDINSEWLIQGVGPMMKSMQIDLFDSPSEAKKTETPLVPGKMDAAQPEIEPVNEVKAEPQVEYVKEIESKHVVPEVKNPEPERIERPVEVKEPKQEISGDKKTDAQPEPEIEKIVILYKNKTFKEYYPGL